MMVGNNDKKKEILKFAKTLVIVLGCWLVVLYGKFNSFARETINRSYETAFDNKKHSNYQDLSLAKPLPEQLPQGFHNEYENDNKIPVKLEESNVPEPAISLNTKYEIYSGSKDDRVCSKKIEEPVKRIPVKEGKLPKYVIIGADKCGTSALGKFLENHPDIIYIGETYFFTRQWSQGQDWIKKKAAGVFEDQHVLEKSPTYYRDPGAPKRILETNPDIKVALVVCPNVKRLVSRYLHLFRTGETEAKKNRVAGIFGDTPAAFMQQALEDIKTFDEYLERLFPNWKDPANSDLVINGLMDRFEKEIIPFKRGYVNNVLGAPASAMMVDGIWPVYLKYWQREMGEDRIIAIDGSMLNVDPAGQLERIQDFFGLTKELTYKSFIFHQNRGILCLQGSNGLPCCPSIDKGRSLGMEYEQEYTQAICNFFKPFDDYMLKMMNLDWPSWRDSCN